MKVVDVVDVVVGVVVDVVVDVGVFVAVVVVGCLVLPGFFFSLARKEVPDKRK